MQAGFCHIYIYVFFSQTTPRTTYKAPNHGIKFYHEQPNQTSTHTANSPESAFAIQGQTIHSMTGRLHLYACPQSHILQLTIIRSRACTAQRECKAFGILPGIGSKENCLALAELHQHRPRTTKPSMMTCATTNSQPLPAQSRVCTRSVVSPVGVPTSTLHIGRTGLGYYTHHRHNRTPKTTTANH